MSDRHHTRRVATLAIHGSAHDRTPGSPVVPPIAQSATFHWGSPDDGELRYSRYGNNPNQIQVSEKAAALEGAEAAIALASGMAATAMALLALTEAGDHVVASSRLYGATQTLLRDELPRRGVQTTFVDPEAGGWDAALRDETRVVWIEIPTNPTLRVLDPRPIVALAHDRGIRVACDATFGSPVNFRAADLGIDVVVQSATKYLGGHSDLIAGVVAGTREIIDEVVRLSRLYGPALDPHAAWLLDRGLRTLDVRVKRHNQNAMAVAEWFEGRPEVARVSYPGLASHPDHVLASELMSGYGGMVSVVLTGGGDAADRFVSGLRLALAAPSLGGVETLVSQPRYTSHVGLSAAEREAQGIPDGFVRLSIGIEDADDLIADFEQALAR
ncbi:MAG: aminotransferase class I/II-fold pyridoxal phosphate-dependent enzyme [Gemmatimonadota bacterium]|nr:aminotransferase class I/II-fold pyridoxal phosphate-dependent enzyme [Gemmatimonadota bacterium]MDH3424116.1 aminotransferase class I/II-fold pyridoxal phosphate-dependent enzyme [Gemmatimonadota bacterium]